MPLNVRELRPQVEAMAANVARKAGRVELVKLAPSRWQPRISFNPAELWELAKSIDENGLINPVVVFPVDDHYELVAGERRVRAVLGLRIGQASERTTPKRAVELLADVGIDGLWSTRVGMKDDPKALLDGATVRARVMPAPETEQDLEKLHRLTIVENLERANLSPLEEARGLQGLIKSYGWSQRELARHLGKSQGWVAQRVGLLTLPQAAQEAVNTRVIGLTHARALQGLPGDVAPAVTEHVAKRVKHGATTREIDSTAQSVKTFFDVDRYDPFPERTYRPRNRNRLRLVRWLLEAVDWRDRAADLMDIVRYGTLDSSLDHLLESYRLERVVRAAGFESIPDAWRAFAADTLRTCDRCVWDAWDWIGDEWTYTFGDPPCELMRDADVGTCQQYIGRGLDPEIVDLPWAVRNGMERLGLAYEEEPFNHLTSVKAFVESFGRVQVAEEQWKQEEQEAKKTGHIDEIRRFYEWQLSLPLEATNHIQAHSCSKCAHRAAGQPPCRFVEEPLIDERRNRTESPGFGAFVTQDGLLLPRCEMFTYANGPTIKRIEGTRFPDREQAMGWLLQLGRSNASPYRKIWAILQWLDCGRRPGESGNEQDLNRLAEYLLTVWDMPGNQEPPFDEQIATLLDVVASESRATGTVIELVNPVTGESERFIPIDLDVATGEDTWPHWRDYPEDWPRPWLNEDKEQQDDETVSA